ncbi:MAG TPA: hypothetical protein VFA68_15745 [Terriglobales bacterium]|nr:hypothetical protein [Terriglobales bacterium]
MSQAIWKLILTFVFFFASTILYAQLPGNPPRLIQLTRKAGYMFSGTVLSVQRVGAKSNLEVDTVAVTFHVDKGLRGAKTGQTLVIREWSGLWSSRERYRPGERVFVFLYPTSRLGLTSTIADDWARLAVAKGNRVALPGSMLEDLPISPALKKEARQTHNLSLRQFAGAIRRASEE